MKPRTIKIANGKIAGSETSRPQVTEQKQAA
jgi:hypothetical protein